MVSTKIKFKNIIATQLSEFNGQKYNSSIYLWEASRRNNKFEKADQNSIPVLNDYHTSKDQISKAFKFCKNIYYKTLPIISQKLNEIHNLTHSTKFWQIVLGYWYFRHICNIYDKYIALQHFDINYCSISLLSKKSFYFPQDHVDYLQCFSQDFGVQQIVSQYFYINNNSNFPIIEKTYTPVDCVENQLSKQNTEIKNIEPFVKKSYRLYKQRIKNYLLFNKLNNRKKHLQPDQEPDIALLNVYFTANIFSEIETRSNGKIAPITPAQVTISKQNPNLEHRASFNEIPAENTFEEYFFKTLFYCFPKDYIENFKDYYYPFKKDINSRNFSYIVNEDWISHIPSAIYVALAKEEKKTAIILEHAYGAYININTLHFMDSEVADLYLTSGWTGNKKAIIPGGFFCKEIKPYTFRLENTQILFITRTKFIYTVEINEYNLANSTFLKEVTLIQDFIDLLPQNLKNVFALRPRKAGDLFWDVERFLNVENKNINIDDGNFTESILKSRIVIIDHMTSGLAEMLLMKVPFILLYNVDNISIPEDIKDIFQDLINVGIIHQNSTTAIQHIENIYDNVYNWWGCDSIQKPVNKLIELTLAPGSKTVEFLLSCL